MVAAAVGNFGGGTVAPAAAAASPSTEPSEAALLPAGPRTSVSLLASMSGSAGLHGMGVCAFVSRAFAVCCWSWCFICDICSSKCRC
jgi:hypothetical protein